MKMTTCISMKPTVGWLLHVYYWLKGGTGERVSLLGGSSLGHLFPEGLRQATLQELSACPELLIVLRVFRVLAAALIKYGNHSWPLPSSLFLAHWGHFGACEKENIAPIDENPTKCWTVNGHLEWDRLPGTALVSLPTGVGFPRTSIRLRKGFWVLLFSGATWGDADWSSSRQITESWQNKSHEKKIEWIHKLGFCFDVCVVLKVIYRDMVGAPEIPQCSCPAH